MSVWRAGAPRRVQSETIGQKFAVPIDGEVSEAWMTLFEDVIARQLDNTSIRPNHPFLQTLKVEPTAITFSLPATEATARLEGFLNVIKTAIGRTNDELVGQQERDEKQAEELRKEQERTDRAIDSALRKWDEENPPEPS